VISGGHVILYSRDAEADRAFFRDVLEYPHVDAGGGWLIFKTPPGELAVHPADGAPAQEFYLMCDDLPATMAELGERGVEFTGPAIDQRWGLVTGIKLPGGGQLGLSQPRHPTAYDLPA
jgi:catechol 2,3-dioxygenase-like lactoylglutathione lyase family enzyme